MEEDSLSFIQETKKIFCLGMHCFSVDRRAIDLIPGTLEILTMKERAGSSPDLQHLCAELMSR